MFVTTRKILAILLCLSLIGCSLKDSSSESTELNMQDNNSDSNESNLKDKEEGITIIEPLLIWSFTDDFLKEVKGFEEQYNAKTTVEVMDINGFVPMVVGVINGGIEMPDVIVVEENQLQNEQLGDLLYDLTSLIEGHETDLYNHSIQKGMIGSDNPFLGGLSYSVSPIGIYYRRSMAMKVLGTDDPKVVSEYFNSIDKLSDMSSRLNEDNIKVFSDLYTLRYFSNLSGNWFDAEGKLEIKEGVRNYLEFLKLVQIEKRVAFANEWSVEWFEGMYRPINTDTGQDMSIFAYVLPNWGLSNILMLAGSSEDPLYKSDDGMIQIYNETKGDWGIAIPNYPRSLGGSYLTINSKSEHIELAKSFVEYMVLDKEHAKQFLEDTDMTSSLKSVTMEQEFEKGTEFVGGQDFHKSFAIIAAKLDYEVIRLSREYAIKSPILNIETTTDAESEATIDANTEAITNTEVDAITNTEAEATIDANAEAIIITEAEATIDANAEAIIITEAEATTNTEAEATTNTEAEATTNTEAEATTNTEAEATTIVDTEITNGTDIDDNSATIMVTNNDIQLIFDAIVIDFMEGKFHTTDEAIKTFEENVYEIYPGLDVQPIDK